MREKVRDKGYFFSKKAEKFLTLLDSFLHTSHKFFFFFVHSIMLLFVCVRKKKYCRVNFVIVSFIISLARKAQNEKKRLQSKGNFEDDDYECA